MRSITKNGKTVTTSLTLDDAAYVLGMNRWPNSFARSLIAEYNRYGASMPKADWLVFLAQEYRDRLKARAAAHPSFNAAQYRD